LLVTTARSAIIEGAVSNGSKLHLLSDLPACEVEEDDLGFAKAARSLASLILASRDQTPFTVGIQGGWGSGKSTLMLWLQSELEAQAGTTSELVVADGVAHDRLRRPAFVVPGLRRFERWLARRRTSPAVASEARIEITTVWFNAWTAQRADALGGLVRAALERLDPSVLRKAARSVNLMTGLRVALTVVLGYFRAGALVDELWKRALDDARARNDLAKLVRDAMERWRDQVPRGVEGRLLVVFVDDLDRCEPDTVYQVFEAIKLYLDARGFVFVIGFDPDAISHTMLQQKGYSESVTPRTFLEKIIQIDYRIPILEKPQVKKLVNNFVERAGARELIEDDARAVVIEEDRTRNPRQIKRVINAFLAAGRDPDVDPKTLIRMLILFHYFPEFERVLDGSEPIELFRDYQEARDALRAADTDGRSAQEALEQHPRAEALIAKRIPSAVGNAKAVLAELEQTLPESFPQLARQSDVVNLVTSISKDKETVARVREAARRATPNWRRALRVTRSLSSVVGSALASVPGVGGFAGLAAPVVGTALDVGAALAGQHLLCVEDDESHSLSDSLRAATPLATVTVVPPRPELIETHAAAFDALVFAGAATLETLERVREKVQRPTYLLDPAITPVERTRAELAGATVLTDVQASPWSVPAASPPPDWAPGQEHPSVIDG
jgi:hypothetical protein